MTSMIISLITHGDAKDPDLVSKLAALHRVLAPREQPSNDTPAAQPKVGDTKSPCTYTCLNCHRQRKLSKKFKAMQLTLGDTFQDPKLCFDCVSTLPEEFRRLPTGRRLALLATPLSSSGGGEKAAARRPPAKAAPPDAKENADSAASRADLGAPVVAAHPAGAPLRAAKSLRAAQLPSVHSTGKTPTFVDKVHPPQPDPATSGAERAVAGTTAADHAATVTQPTAPLKADMADHDAIDNRASALAQTIGEGEAIGTPARKVSDPSGRGGTEAAPGSGAARLAVDAREAAAEPAAE